MILYFEKNNEKQEIGQPTGVEDTWNIILDFCAKRDFTINNVRSWTFGNKTYYDLGSYSEIFILEK